MDDLDSAIHDTVKDFPGGGVALAGKVGMVAGTLLNKANPGQDAQLTLRESVPLQLVSADFRILYAYADVLNHVRPVPLGNFKQSTNLDLIHCLTRFHADIGLSAEDLDEALAGKKLTREHVRKVRKHLLCAAQAGHELLLRLEGLCDE